MGNRFWTPEQRFWQKVDKDGPILIPELGRCWIWTGAKTEQGYGEFGFEGKVVKAHTWLFERTIMRIPVGYEPDHLCNNPPCVRFSHLEVVTKRENILRWNGPTAVNARKTNCIRGHELSGDNLKIHPDGRRECRACARKSSLASYYRSKG